MLNEISIYGNLNLPDYFISLTINTQQELYITGYGQSYGSPSPGEDNAYLVQWNATPIVISSQIPSNSNWEIPVIVILIVGLTIVVVIAAIKGYKKNK